MSSAQCSTTAKDKEEMSIIPYASAIGSIMYAMLCTRPDVNLAVSLVGRYQSNPGMALDSGQEHPEVPEKV